MNEKAIGVGLLGCGVVGSALCRQLASAAGKIQLSAGCPVAVKRVAVRDLSKSRDVDLPPDLFTDDPEQVIKDPDVDVVVEVMGGLDPAERLILEALSAGKPVVTANKELISARGGRLYAAAESAGTDLFFEASVGGGIPIIRPLQQSLAGEMVRRVTGIVNGTTNYILTKMTEEGLALDDALRQAQELGYAEADPTSDVEGYDAAAKTAILASIAFNASITQQDVYREGINAVTASDIAFADRLGYVVKLLSIAEAREDGIEVRVHPAMIPKTHPLAAVRDSFNAVFVEGGTVGELMFYGRGAGGGPTATSVAGDIVEAVRHLRSGGRASLPRSTETRLIPFEEVFTQYYLLLEVADRPGVLASISKSFGDHGVSIASVWQEGHGDEAQLVMITHRARERDLQATIDDLRGLEAVSEVASVLRVEAEEA